MVKRTSTSIFSQNKSIGCCSWAFAGKYSGSQADAETMSFNLDVTFHENDLEEPTLQPPNPEGICHEALLGTRSPYGAMGSVQAVLSGNPVQSSCGSGFLAVQTRVMKCDSAWTASKPALRILVLMSSLM